MVEMLLNGSDNEKLFAKLVPVTLKDVYTNQTRNSHLFLTMEWQDASAGMYNRKVLAISLTDNNDPFFLYNLHLSEEDFQMLKSSQELLIDFASFPQHIIDYIEKCLLEEKNPQPKFLLVFTVNDKLGNVAAVSQLDIVETNNFKHLTYVSLKFIAATESTVKQYLATCFRHLKEEKRQLQNSLAFLEQDSKDKLAACQRNLGNKIQELDLIIKNLNVKLNMKDDRHAQDLQEERNRLLNMHEEEKERFERERKERERNFRKDIKEFQSKVTNLESLNKELQDKNYLHDNTIRGLNSKVLSLDDEVRRLRETAQSYKQKCDQLHSEAKDQQFRICEQDEVINGLQQELRNKDQSIRRLKDQVESEKDFKRILEEDLKEVNRRLDLSDKAKIALLKEKEKLNDIIVSLQEKSKEASKEEKIKSQQVSKYKKIVDEKEKALLDTKKEICELNMNLQVKIAETKSLTDSNISLQKKLEEVEKELKTRENVIKYLKQKLTEETLINYIPPSNSATSPSSIAQKQLAKISSSSSPESSPPIVTARNTVPKSVRINAASPDHRRGSLVQSQLQNTRATDSAYSTSPSDFAKQSTSEIIQGNHNLNFNSTNFEIDAEALNAAFGDGNHVLKHSTAKKPAKPVKSTIPKISKKR